MPLHKSFLVEIAGEQPEKVSANNQILNIQDIKKEKYGIKFLINVE